jgi:hypothetical protein
MLEIIGHYRIRRKIGQGAMGVVYEGWDERLERLVAIKTILEANESKEARSRLWREARSLARVNHPNVCQVFDVLEEGESLVLILKLLDGQSLADRLVTGMITTSEALGIECQILCALQALHDLGIVHRDLKPSNVFFYAPRQQAAGFRFGPNDGCDLYRRPESDANNHFSDRARTYRWHTSLHGAGAGQWSPRRSTCGHFRGWLHPLRNADWQAAIRRPFPCGRPLRRLASKSSATQWFARNRGIGPRHSPGYGQACRGPLLLSPRNA